MNNNNSQRVLIIAGCNLHLTPVVRAYIEYLENIRVAFDVVEYVPGRRWEFIKKSIYRIIHRNTYTKSVFVNFQSLPILFIAALWMRSATIYWKLESYSAFDNRSLALKLQLFEWLLPRSRIPLVLPVPQRASIQRPQFESVFFLPNAPFRPYVRSEQNGVVDPLQNLIIYGNIGSSDEIYINDWVKYFKKNQCGRLFIYGESGATSQHVLYGGKINHGSLIQKLLSGGYGYSLVGYRALNANSRLAAPNKLIESLACGMPVIGHSKNPFVADIIERYNCGICIDFDKIDSQILTIDGNDHERHRRNAIIAARELCLETQIRHTPLAITL